MQQKVDSVVPLPLVRVPWLDLIRGFVAVGRRMSVTLAAQDLCVTQPAISRQIAALEDRLGVRLFVRGYRSISFTPEGERLFAVSDAGLAELQEVLGALVSHHPDRFAPIQVDGVEGFARP
jgi:DNA-binding transcriptional LysR family regulator